MYQDDAHHTAMRIFLTAPISLAESHQNWRISFRDGELYHATNIRYDAERDGPHSYETLEALLVEVGGTISMNGVYDGDCDGLFPSLQEYPFEQHFHEIREAVLFHKEDRASLEEG